MNWGHSDPLVRGPVVATVKHGGQRNAIGAHGGGYCIYTALAVAAGELVNIEYEYLLLKFRFNTCNIYMNLRTLIISRIT